MCVRKKTIAGTFFFLMRVVLLIGQSISQTTNSVALGVLENFGVNLAFFPTQADVHVKIVFQTVLEQVDVIFCNFQASGAVWRRKTDLYQN